MKNIDILLATYNGEKFVKEQISSIIENLDKISGYNSRILISDDGSTDGTISIINENFGCDRRVLVINTNRLGGVKNNFNFLINNTDADFVFFCDQDDFWLPDKVSVFLKEFNIEKNYQLPLLIHSDLCVVDINLQPIHESMFEYQKLNKAPSFENAIVSNSITGCVAAINKPLLHLLKKSHLGDSIMHDWYAGLIASAFGKIIFIQRSLILYRQHGNNQVGAQKFTLKKIFSSHFYMKTFNSINLTRLQAKNFLGDFSDTLEPEKYNALESYINSFDMGIVYRMKLFFFRDFTKYGLSRSCAFFLFYVFLGGKMSGK